MPYLYNTKSVGKPNVYKQTARGAGLPITVLEAKEQLLIPALVTTWDSYILSLINSGITHFENFTKQTLIETTYIGYYNTFEASVLLEKSPLRSIISVTYFDENNTEQTVDSANYYTTLSDYYSYLLFVNTYSIPSTYDRPQILKVEFNAGLATDDTDTPKDIKQGFLMYVAFMYENRGDCINADQIPSVINDMFFPYKILNIVKNTDR